MAVWKAEKWADELVVSLAAPLAVLKADEKAASLVSDLVVLKANWLADSLGEKWVDYLVVWMVWGKVVRLVVT